MCNIVPSITHFSAHGMRNMVTQKQRYTYGSQLRQLFLVSQPVNISATTST